LKFDFRSIGQRLYGGSFLELYFQMKKREPLEQEFYAADAAIPSQDHKN
jgi:hypothetical protein